jgi:uncharacterized protein YbjT (DUF2867 family)
MKILITGATGNVGQAMIKHYRAVAEDTLYLATRKKTNPTNSNLRYFDFDNLPESLSSLAQIDLLFLLRPPHISDVNTYFEPLIEACKKFSVKHIIFLSVQGADKASFIPHAKIEKMILHTGIAYTFIRPAYFMQNLSTTLQKDIIKKNRIFLPAGSATFNWIDVEDIGMAIARILEQPSLHINKIYTLTGSQNLTFQQAATYLTETLRRKIDYTSPSLFRFYIAKRKEGMSPAFILVMILLHFIPRFQKPPLIHPDFEQLTGRKPNPLRQFIASNQNLWQTKTPAHS